MIDLDLRFRMTPSLRGPDARGPRRGIRTLLLLAGVIVVLALGSRILGVTPQSLLDAIT